jgi:uncharacterized membrane protein
MKTFPSRNARSAHHHDVAKPAGRQIRLTAAHDHEVNLKAEIEIMALHEKLDEFRAKEIAELLKHVVKAKSRCKTSG